MAPPVTKNIVAHDCEKGGRVRPVQGLKLDPGPEPWTLNICLNVFLGKKMIGLNICLDCGWLVDTARLSSIKSRSFLVPFTSENSCSTSDPSGLP